MCTHTALCLRYRKTLICVWQVVLMQAQNSNFCNPYAFLKKIKIYGCTSLSVEEKLLCLDLLLLDLYFVLDLLYILP